MDIAALIVSQRVASNDGRGCIEEYNEAPLRIFSSYRSCGSTLMSYIYIYNHIVHYNIIRSPSSNNNSYCVASESTRNYSHLRSYIVSQSTYLLGFALEVITQCSIFVDVLQSSPGLVLSCLDGFPNIANCFGGLRPTQGGVCSRPHKPT